ncbi:MAG: FAD-dependent oxidoreductase [Desulfopila sp.]|jgi:predicted NAD/FAD-binding protein|nr:FAD-dependent oxidoreductase [Desulfopila sp.]
MSGKRIAIIGTGISGLTCAYHLSRRNEVTVFESADYVGGHTHTVKVEKNGETAWIDTGFIVFNDRTYPNFIRMMEDIGVARQKTEMSFSVRNDGIGLEYNGGSMTGLFAQPGNLVRPEFWGLLREILRFNREVRNAAEDNSMTLGQFLDQGGYSILFRENYIIPMVSAIWSMGFAGCFAFPLSFFVKFFDNHGLLDITNRPQWYTIKGGSSSYIEPLVKGFKQNIRLNTAVTGVQRQNGSVAVETAFGTELFDEAILACHGDQALALIKDPSPKEKEVLSAFTCSENDVILHTDTSHLPKAARAWAGWNYQVVNSAQEQATLTYNMNILQRLDSPTTYLVTLNQNVAEEHVLARFQYRHPVFTTAAVRAQDEWESISGVASLHFCGAYWRNGFHEDGVFSALRVCRAVEGKA